MHDRLKSRKVWNPGPSQSSGRRDSETLLPDRPRAVSRKRSHRRARITKGFVPGGNAGAGPGALALSSAITGSFASTAAHRARMCFRAVRGSMQPSTSQASSVSPGFLSPSSNSASLALRRGLRGMRCSGSILLVYGHPVLREAWQRMTTTRIRRRTPSLP
jgi:hypothetical protein